VTYNGQDGVRRIYAFRKLRLTPETPVYMVVFVGLPQARLLAQARGLVLRDLGLLGLAAALALGLAWWLGQAVIGRRLRAVAATAGRVREGELTARTGLPHDASELGQVARTVDEMAQALAERGQEQCLADQALRLSLREKEVLLKEIHHRVKNNLQIVASLISLQSLEMEGLPQAQEALSSLGDRVRSMALVHERLYMSGDFSAVDMGHYLVALVGHIASANKQVEAKVEMDVRAEGLRLAMDRALPCGLAISEMITNAYKHAFAPGQAGTVRVGLCLEDGQAVVSVADDGRGLNPDAPRPQSLGLQLVEELTAQLHGSLSRLPGPGTSLELRFPV
jgi:two-component sensor histidine kinase